MYSKSWFIYYTVPNRRRHKTFYLCVIIFLSFFFEIILIRINIRKNHLDTCLNFRKRDLEKKYIPQISLRYFILFETVTTFLAFAFTWLSRVGSVADPAAASAPASTMAGGGGWALRGWPASASPTGIAHPAWFPDGNTLRSALSSYHAVNPSPGRLCGVRPGEQCCLPCQDAGDVFAGRLCQVYRVPFLPDAHTSCTPLVGQLTHVAECGNWVEGEDGPAFAPSTHTTVLQVSVPDTRISSKSDSPLLIRWLVSVQQDFRTKRGIGSTHTRAASPAASISGRMMLNRRRRTASAPPLVEAART